MTSLDEMPGSAQADRLEIRLLGNLRVRRADGTVLDAGALRTRKTADLLRLLALRVGEPVSSAVLVQRLWPDVPERRGRASLRTACSTIRGAVGAECVERTMEGIVLSGAWVDAFAFHALATQSRLHLRDGRPAQAVVAAREAEALYLHDFRADDDTAPWVVAEREQLRAVHHRLLEDAAEAALSLRWYRDVVDLASRVVARDPFAERSVRALMTGYAATGQVERALRTFQACRRALVNELGVEPSAQTDELHVAILRGEVGDQVHVSAPLVGRDAQLTRLVGLLQQERHGPAVVEVRGRPRAGQRRLVAEAVRRLGPVQVDVTTPDRLGARLDLVPAPGGCLVVVADTDDPPVRELLHDHGMSWHLVELPDLDLVTTGALVEALLGGPATPALVRFVAEQAQGAAGAVVGTVRDVLRARRVVSTSEGVALLPENLGVDAGPIASGAVARALQVLDVAAHEVLFVLAVADRPLPTSSLRAVLPAWCVPHLQDRLAAADDLAVIAPSPDGWGLRDPLVGAAVRAWLRPSVRRALELRLAEVPGRHDRPYGRVRTELRGARRDDRDHVEDAARALGIIGSTPLPVVERRVLAARRELSWQPGGVGSERAAALDLLRAERVLMPRRDLAGMDGLLSEVEVTTGSTRLNGEAQVLRWLPRVLLGHAASALDPLQEAVEQCTDEGVRARLRRLVVLAEVDLGRAGVVAPSDRDLACPGAVRFPVFALLVVRQHLDLPRLQRLGDRMVGAPLHRQLQALLAVDRHLTRGDQRSAVDLLRAAAADAAETGCTLMLPEIAARLVALECRTDPELVADDFDAVDLAIGPQAPHPRERCLKLLARAHLRASRGSTRAGAEAADAAAQVAAAHSLRPLADDASRLAAALRAVSRGHRIQQPDTRQPGARQPGTRQPGTQQGFAAPDADAPDHDARHEVAGDGTEVAGVDGEVAGVAEDEDAVGRHPVGGRPGPVHGRRVRIGLDQGLAVDDDDPVLDAYLLTAHGHHPLDPAPAPAGRGEHDQVSG